jgi:hypothetical protein
VFAVHGTKKLLDRVGRPGPGEVPPTTALGNWYATDHRSVVPGLMLK